MAYDLKAAATHETEAGRRWNVPHGDPVSLPSRAFMIASPNYVFCSVVGASLARLIIFLELGTQFVVHFNDVTCKLLR